MTYSRDDYLEDLYYAKELFDHEDRLCEYKDKSCHGKRGYYEGDLFLCEYHGTEYVRNRTRTASHFEVDS